MKAYILAVFILLFLLGCDDGVRNSSRSVSEQSPVPDNATPNANVNGVTILSAGYNSVPVYDGSDYWTLLYNVPGNAAGSVSYEISADGSETAAKVVREADDFSASDISDPELQFHMALRQDEADLLSSGLSQIVPVMRKGPSGINVNDKWNGIYVSRDASSGEIRINATCVAVSEYAYFFLEDGFSRPSDSLLEEYKREFDNMYPIMHDKFGYEGDVDGNGKVIILLFKMTDERIAGYFSSADKYNRYEIADSNEADMLYVNYDLINYEKSDVLATIAHEFQHMILFNSRYELKLPDLEVWLNEGLSMQAEFWTGYLEQQSSDYLGGFLKNYSSLGLTDWSNASYLNYGYSMVYVRYLVDRFGDDIVKKLYKAPYKKGVFAVANATGIGFNDIFKDFVLALFVSGKGITNDPKYNFKTLNIKSGLEDSAHPAGNNYKGNIRPYGMQLLHWQKKITGANITGNVKGFGSALTKKINAPNRIRTYDLRLRRPLLYPAEL